MQRGWIALAIMALLPWAMLAQVTSGSISGVVADSSGAVVPDALVTVSNRATGIARTTRSAEDGSFVVPQLPPGTYTVAAEKQGFQKSEKTGVVLSAADRLSLGDFVMSVGDIATTVTVNATAAELQVQSQSGERSDLLSGNQINNLALNGRNILDMVKVIPGVVSEVNGQVSGRGELGSFNINGTRGNQHQLTIDGSSNVDTGNNAAVHVTVNPDAIAEVKILTSNYQAEYGKAGGGALAIVTKNGTSDFHGDFRYFHRHEGLNANNWFNNQLGRTDAGNPVSPVPIYRYNYVGYNIGGPVIVPGTGFNKNRDKLFFFFSQEFYQQLIPSGNPVNARVPTVDEINGNFANTVDGNGNPIILRDPLNGNAPFANNQIPEDRLLPGVRDALLKIYPRPNISGRNDYNFTSQASGVYPRREDIIRVDYQLSSAHRVYGRLVNNAGRQELPYGAAVWGISNFQFPGGMIFQEPGWNGALNLVSTLSPTLVNEFTFGPSVSRLAIDAKDNNVSRAKYGIDIPLLFPVAPESPIPDFSFNGIPNQSLTWSYLGSLPFDNSNTTLDITDTISKIFAKHSLKAGFFLQRNRKDQPSWGNANGQFNFDGSDTGQQLQTGHPYANALLGYYTTFNQTSQRPRGFYRYTNLEWYVQDTWRVTPRFTLDYGLRFGWYQPQYDARMQSSVFNPSLYDPSKAPRLYHPDAGGNAFDPANPGVTLPGNLVGTLVPNSGDLANGFGQASSGYPKGGFDDRGIMAEPRFGFALQLTGDGKTVLRGGAGMMHDRIQGNLIYNPVNENPPRILSPSLVHGRIQDLPSLASSPSLVLSPARVFGVEKSGKVPTIYSFSVGIQRALGWGTTMDVSYVGALSRHLVQTRNLNALPYGTAFTRAAQDPSRYPNGVVPAVEPDLPSVYAQAGLSYSGTYSYDTNFLRPYQGYGMIQYYEFNGSSNYNSLQVSANRRFANSLTFGLAYTFSKTLVTASSDEDWTNPFFPRAFDYRLASWDRPHVLAINYVYDLPKFSKWMGGSKWLSYVTDGFQISGITQFMSGAPFDAPIWSSSHQITGSPAGPEWNQPPMYPYVSGDVNHSVGTSKFDPTRFVAPSVGIPAPWPRTYMRGGGLNNFDISVFKNIPFSSDGKRSIQLRAEAFNAFNHPNFRDVNVNMWLDPPQGTGGPVLHTTDVRPAGVQGNYGQYFGEYTNTYNAAGGPRVLQLGLKIYF